MNLDSSIQFLLALICYAASAVISFFQRKTADVGSAALAIIGSLIGIYVSVSSFFSAHPIRFSSEWHIPGGNIELSIDPLSAAFLVLLFLVAALGSIHGLGYWRRSEHPRSATSVRFFYSLMTIALAVVFTARHSILFLVAWEMMAISAFFLIAAEDEIEDVRKASWIYFVATHAGTVCLIAAFVLLRIETGTFTFVQNIASNSSVSIIFILALLGFGLKAGLIPLHFWLPSAHSNAPSHVSALLSGVMLKAGIYGILRITSLPSSIPAWWPFLLGLIAAATAVVGILLALVQTDIKRALAYSSVENMGVICLGIALALAGRSGNQPVWIVLGLGGAITHVWSHGTFKSLLFFASGGIVHAAHTRSMEKMGGLLKPMPATGLAFLAGSLAAAGLPFFNGFASEWLILNGFFQAIQSGAASGLYMGFAAPALGLAGAFALASFLRIFSIVFLGSPRSSSAGLISDSSRLMIIPILLLAAICIFFGVLPSILWKPISPIISSWGRIPVQEISGFVRLPLRVLIPFAAILTLSTGLLLALAGKRSRRSLTWDCGYADPTTRMQYTASSSGEWISQKLLPQFLQPSTVINEDKKLFPQKAFFSTEAADPFSSRFYEPLVARWANRFERLRWLQQGRLTIYLVYIFVTMMCGVLWAAVREYLK